MDVVCQGRKKGISEREYIKRKNCSEKHLRKCVDPDYKEPHLKIYYPRIIKYKGLVTVCKM